MRKFGIGQPAARFEDRRFLTGTGRYLDDDNLPGQAIGVFLRSPHAHARLGGIDLDTARAAPGVLGVYTGEDLRAAGVGDLPCLADAPGEDGSACYKPPRPALAVGRVRHVGEPVALIVAESRAAALDAAEQILIDYEELPAVAATAEAMAESAPRLWDDAPDNRCFDWRTGDAGAVAEAFAHATHRVELELVNNRLAPNTMEPRGCIAALEDGRMVLQVSCQGVHIMRFLLTRHVFHCAMEDMRVICRDVGGGFGAKIFCYPEYVATLHAARELGRPVKWVAERGESFLSDSHGRDHVTRLEAAFDAELRMTGLRVSTVANLGASLSSFAPFVASSAGAAMLTGCYRIPAAHVRMQGVFTNTAPVDAYRGAGRPEAIYAIERLMDVAAGRLGVSPGEIRRRNLITAAEMPFETALGSRYDSGDFPKILELALEKSDWESFAARRAGAKRAGKLRGIGMASYVERCAGGQPEQARLQVAGDGGVTLFIGTLSNGQGHETAFRQILCESLGIDPGWVSIVQGDSDAIASGGGTMGSRSVPVGGAAIAACAGKLIAAAGKEAAEMLEAAEADIRFAAGRFQVAGTDRSLGFAEVAARAAPADGGASFDETDGFAPDQPTYPNGVHVVELEIDPDTGRIELVNYVVVDDFGQVINPSLLRGQVHGGIVQGLGQALLEDCHYDPDSGQLLSASFMDYAMPRADDCPDFDFSLHLVRCETNPLGIKGAGEAGAIGAPPAIMNAIANALADYGVEHVDMPATPHRLWSLLDS